MMCTKRERGSFTSLKLCAANAPRWPVIAQLDWASTSDKTSYGARFVRGARLAGLWVRQHPQNYPSWSRYDEVERCEKAVENI